MGIVPKLSRSQRSAVRFTGFSGETPEWEGISARRIARFVHGDGRIVLAFIVAVAVFLSGLTSAIIRGSWTSLGIGMAGLAASVLLYALLRTMWKGTPPD